MESEAKRDGLKELQRWHKVVREKPKILLKITDIMVKVKVTEYPDSKWYVNPNCNPSSH